MGNVYLREAPLLCSLPDGLRFGRTLMIEGNERLVALPNGLRVGGGLILRQCLALSCLPKGIDVGGAITLDGCRDLGSLPKGMQVTGFLSLRDCVSLVSLPAQLDVRDWLDLQGCTSWDGHIPDSLQVGYRIYTDKFSYRGEAGRENEAPDGESGISLVKWRDLGHPQLV